MDSRKYTIVGAFDTETTNCGDVVSGFKAFPILYQFATITCDILDLTPDTATCVNVETFRQSKELYSYIDSFIGVHSDVIPVVLVHNLGFDMYALAPYLNSHNVKILAKTSTKPISIQILNNDGNPAIVFLDTVGLFMKSLATMGEECGMPKAIGEWDYNLVRAPSTDLSDEELNYARRDTITLLCYMAYFLRQNPDIDPHDIGMRVQTKTGIVRSKRMKHLGILKGKNLPKRVKQYWHLYNKESIPHSDDELFTLHASTRGGFTFCARNNASKVFHSSDSMAIESYDSTSQHPGQMCSHLYPIDFKLGTPEQLLLMFEACESIDVKRMLAHWAKPFPFAFYGAFSFENLRPKAGSIYEREGIFPLASARISGMFPLYDNQANQEYKENIGKIGYKDRAEKYDCAFGKLERAETCVLFLTELESWIVSRCYDYDSINAISGYWSSTFRKPSDLSLLSVMRFYKAKNALKDFMKSYKPGEPNDSEILSGLYPDSFVDKCRLGVADDTELKEYYQLSKSDLNALFGIEATNECRRDYELGEDGIYLAGEDGIHNMPSKPKCSYQYGQRIVGWSRIAQICIIELISPYVKNIICGDTDSLKIYYERNNVEKIKSSLSKHAKALDRARKQVTKRIKTCYKNEYIDLDGIGHYVLDGSYDAFSASWNKAYISLNDNKCHVTLAGIPNRRSPGKRDSLNDFCNSLISQGMSFDDIASIIIGYNVTYDYSILKLNGRIHPKWGDRITEFITDYKGDKHYVDAPAALALFAMPKTIGDTSSKENYINSVIAKKNNPSVNIVPAYLRWYNGRAIVEGCK